MMPTCGTLLAVRETERGRRGAGPVSVLTGWAGSAAARSWAPGAAQLDVASSFLFFLFYFPFLFPAISVLLFDGITLL
jgi:hypothetical protein